MMYTRLLTAWTEPFRNTVITPEVSVVSTNSALLIAMPEISAMCAHIDTQNCFPGLSRAMSGNSNLVGSRVFTIVGSARDNLRLTRVELIAVGECRLFHR
jgi:hypothetical protein